MIFRFRPLGVSLAVALTLSACSSTPTSTRTSAPAPGRVVLSRTSPTDIRTAQINVSASDLHAENTWDSPHYSLQWPTLDQAPGLSRDLAAQVSNWRKDFVSDTASGGQDHAELDVAWDPVVQSRNLYGVRLTNRLTSGDSALTSATQYGEGDESWSSQDLLEPDARQMLARAVASAADTTFHSDMGADVDPDGVFTDVSFATSGDLLVRLPEGVVAPMSEGTLYARVANPQRYLSARGAQVRAAMTKQVTSTPMQPAVTAPGGTSDCSVLKCIALTFDDGPGPYTAQILDTLEKERARATFFMLGPAVQADPGIVRRMASLGMGLGDHSWTHPQFTNLSAAQVTNEITEQASAVKAATGQEPVAVRPPYGAFTTSTPHAGYPFVLWDVDTQDWKNRNATVTTQRALNGAHRGAIVLMHDIHASTAQALPGIVDALQKQGYTLVPVNELLPNMSKTGAYYSAK